MAGNEFGNVGTRLRSESSVQNSKFSGSLGGWVEVAAATEPLVYLWSAPPRTGRRRVPGLGIGIELPAA
jgi:hypothetical protein